MSVRGDPKGRFEPRVTRPYKNQHEQVEYASHYNQNYRCINRCKDQANQEPPNTSCERLGSIPRASEERGKDYAEDAGEEGGDQGAYQSEDQRVYEVSLPGYAAEEGNRLGNDRHNRSDKAGDRIGEGELSSGPSRCRPPCTPGLWGRTSRFWSRVEVYTLSSRISSFVT